MSCLVNVANVQIALQQMPQMIHQALVGELDSLEILHLLGQTVVAENRPTQAKRIGRARRHVLHQAMFDLLEDDVQIFSLSLQEMQLVVLDHHLPFAILDHFGHLFLRFAFHTLTIHGHDLIAGLQDACSRRKTLLGPIGQRLEFVSNESPELTVSGGGRIVEHLDQVAARTVRPTASDRDPNQIALVLYDLHDSRGGRHAAETQKKSLVQGPISQVTRLCFKIGHLQSVLRPAELLVFVVIV